MTREEAMDIFEHNWTKLVNPDYTEEELNKAIGMAIKALEQEPCDDCVSREAVINTIMPYCSDDDGSTGNLDDLRNVLDDIESLPRVQPKRDKGEWKHGICDKCGYDWSKDAPIASVPNICPHCGADMRGEQNGS